MNSYKMLKVSLTCYVWLKGLCAGRVTYRLETFEPRDDKRLEVWISEESKYPHILRLRSRKSLLYNSRSANISCTLMFEQSSQSIPLLNILIILCL